MGTGGWPTCVLGCLRRLFPQSAAAGSLLGISLAPVFYKMRRAAGRYFAIQSRQSDADRHATCS